MDIVTVSFLDEIDFLILQARSLRCYADHNSIGDIYVLNNDVHGAEFSAKFTSDVLPAYGALAPRVQLVHGEDLVSSKSETYGHEGWRRQQSLKLAIYKYVKSDVYVTLDSKNFLVRPFSFSYFRTEDGRLLSDWRIFKAMFEPAFSDYGVSRADLPQMVLNIQTPFALWRDIVSEMNEDSNKRFGYDIAYRVLRKPDVYEYGLYGAFIHMSRGSTELLHAKDEVPRPQLRAGCDFDRFKKLISDEHVSFAAVHRFVAQDAAERRDFASALWLEKGLVDSMEDGANIFERLAKNL